MEKTITKNFSAKFRSFLKHPFVRSNEPMLHTIEWLFVLFAFFAIGFPMIHFQSRENFLAEGKLRYFGTMEFQAPSTEEKEAFIGEVVPEPIDTTSWDTYQNKWYGFEIQHPDTWKNNTQYKTATEKSAKYDIIYKFRKSEAAADDVFSGYDVKIYSVKKVQKIENTNEIRRKNDVQNGVDECSLVTEEKALGENNLIFQKISIDEGDNCFEPAYFFSLTKDGYIYNLVPVVGGSGERFAYPEKETKKMFPEYQEAVSSFKNIPIARPATAAPAKPKIAARRPVAAKTVGGKLVCAKKNDKPRKSKKNKPGHLDLECCLDPDERPNPWCTY